MTTSAMTLLNNPYVGPRTFNYDDRQLYFGREREARTLLARVISARLLLFYAQSGAGKSSLINTRLIPHLREEEDFSVLPVGRVSGQLPADVAEVDNIFVFNLITSLDQSSGNPAPLTQLTLAEFLAHLVTDDGLEWRYEPRPAVEAMPTPFPPTSEAAPSARFALIIDQFEELFTTHPERWQERRAFFCQLDAALEANPNLWVVLTLREDYVATVDPYAPLLFNRLRARFYMERMDVNAALEAVQAPARLYGRPFGPGVAEVLVQDLSRIKVLGQTTAQPGQYVEPVQLQVVCYQLWENLAKQRPLVIGTADHDLISMSDLAAAGDVDTALARFYEETVVHVLAVAEAPVSERQLRTWFDTQLITSSGTRGLVLQGVEETGGLPNDVVSQLQTRFLVRTESCAGGAWVELVHDRFVEPIQQANQAWLVLHADPLTQAARAWDASGKSTWLLYSGRRLREANDQLRGKPGLYGELEKQFLQAAEQRERRVRNIVITVVILLVMFAGLAALGTWMAFQASQSEQRAVDAAATAVVERVRANEETKRANQEAVNAKQAQQEAESVNAKLERVNRDVLASQLAHAAQDEITGSTPDPSLALLLAQEAISITLRTNSYVHPDALRVIPEVVAESSLWRMNLPKQGHSERITCAAYSPDGKSIVTAGMDGVAKVWDVATGDIRLTLLGHTGPISYTAYSPNGESIVTASDDHTVKIWDAISGKGIRTLRGHAGRVNIATYSPDGKLIVTASDDGTAKVWETAGRLRLTFPADKRAVRSAVFSPNSELIVTAGDNYVRVWDVGTGQLRCTLQPTSWDYVGPYRSTAFSPDSETIVTASANANTALWNATDCSPKGILSGHTDSVNFVAYDPTGQSIVTASDDGTAKVWEPTGELRFTLGGHTGPVHSAVFSKDSKSIVTASDDGLAKIWNTRMSPEYLTLQNDKYVVYSAAYSPDGKLLATASTDGAITVWDATNGLRRVSFSHPGGLYLVAWRPDGKAIITAGRDHNARVWDATTGQQLLPPLIHTDEVLSAGYSHDSKFIITAGRNNLAQIWDAATSQLYRDLAGHTLAVTFAAFSPDNKFIITTSDDKTARIWDATTGSLLHILSGYLSPVVAAAFSPDGKSAVTASYDSTARVWDVATGQLKLTLVGHAGWVTFVAYSPDGKSIITASLDKTAIVWDAETGLERFTLQGHTAEVYAAEFSPDGASIITASGDGTVRIWPATPEGWSELANRFIQRYPPVLTTQERKEYKLDNP